MYSQLTSQSTTIAMRSYTSSFPAIHHGGVPGDLHPTVSWPAPLARREGIENELGMRCERGGYEGYQIVGESFTESSVLPNGRFEVGESGGGIEVGPVKGEFDGKFAGCADWRRWVVDNRESVRSVEVEERQNLVFARSTAERKRASPQINLLAKVALSLRRLASNARVAPEVLALRYVNFVLLGLRQGEEALGIGEGLVPGVSPSRKVL